MLCVDNDTSGEYISYQVLKICTNIKKFRRLKVVVCEETVFQNALQNTVQNTLNVHAVHSKLLQDYMNLVCAKMIGDIV